MPTFIMSDSEKCSDFDIKLAAFTAWLFRAKRIIHVGDIWDKHLGLPLFDEFEVYVYITEKNINIPDNLPSNWHLIEENDPIIKIDGKPLFYVNHHLGLDAHLGFNISRKEPINLVDLVMNIHQKYGYIPYALFGHSHNQFTTSEQGTAIINPGSWEDKLCWAVMDPHDFWGIKLYTHTRNMKRVWFAREEYWQ